MEGGKDMSACCRRLRETAGPAAAPQSQPCPYGTCCRPGVVQLKPPRSTSFALWESGGGARTAFGASAPRHFAAAACVFFGADLRPLKKLRAAPPSGPTRNFSLGGPRVAGVADWKGVCSEGQGEVTRLRRESAACAARVSPLRLAPPRRSRSA